MWITNEQISRFLCFSVRDYFILPVKTYTMSMVTDLTSIMVNDNRTGSGEFLKPLVSVAIMDIFSVVNGFVLSSFISCLGIFTNTANIIVYSRMGLSESSNINFLALWVIDFFVSFVTFFLKFLYSPILRDLSTGPMTSTISTSLGPIMLCAVGASAMMTALISTERFLCVVFPLKVRNSPRFLSSWQTLNRIVWFRF